ncbi:glycoside hydrolase family 130 protein [Cohnella suwonensis]|uniref:Glycoside hydrolase family 130 protein n=1 Tax=Cohnella suwonensis TaxID=696072 RepID=A0ABW0LN53_9BACL
MTTATKRKQLLVRYEKNPIITPNDMPFDCYSVMNAGATMFNGKVLLLLRVENLRRKTEFYVATSGNGIDFEICEEPIQYSLSRTEERFGEAHRFDMRITQLEGKYYVFHAAWLDPFGCSIGLATTEDFVKFTPMHNLSEPSNRNAVLFPEKINGLYARLDRPQNYNGKGSTWISYSPDLEFWGRSMPLNMPSTSWNVIKNGAGSIPIKTDKGWLEIYHATAHTASTENYYLGVMLLDLEDPSKVIAAPEEFILAAEKEYECVGQTPNVVFTSGAVEMPDGTLNIYYGGADTRMCLAQTTVGELVEFCLEAAK